MLAFLVFPVVLVMLQVSSQEKISLLSFSSCHSFAGESTIWIQDDGLQVLHHYQERFETLFFRRFNMVNSLVRDYNYCCWYLHIIFMRVLWDLLSLWAGLCQIIIFTKEDLTFSQVVKVINRCFFSLSLIKLKFCRFPVKWFGMYLLTSSLWSQAHLLVSRACIFW